MLKNIYYQRYGKIMIGVLLIFAFIYLGSAWSSQKSWHQQYNYLHSEKFQREYEQHPEYYVKEYDGEKEVYYTSFKEYTEDVSHVFIKDSSSENEEIQYHDRFSPNIGGFVLILLLILGFLLFFIDQKMNFNRFLFSLPCTRKKLFWEKIRSLFLPFIIGLFLCMMGNILIRYFMIPQPYMNISFSALFLSVLSSFSLNVFILCLGIFFGVLLGNLVFGPLSIFFGLFIISNTFYSFWYSCRLIIAYVQGKDIENIQYEYSNFLVTWPNGNSNNWLAFGLFLFLGLAFLFLSQKVFSGISMENDGDYLTVPKLRLPFFFFLAFGTFFYFEMAFGFFASYIQGYESLLQASIFSLTLLLICLVSAGLLIYFHSLKLWWSSKQQLKNNH